MTLIHAFIWSLSTRNIMKEKKMNATASKRDIKAISLFTSQRYTSLSLSLYSSAYTIYTLRHGKVPITCWPAAARRCCTCLSLDIVPAVFACRWLNLVVFSISLSLSILAQLPLSISFSFISRVDSTDCYFIFFNRSCYIAYVLSFSREFLYVWRI